MSKQKQGELSRLFMNTISEEVNNLCVSIKKRDSLPPSRILEAQDALYLFNRSPQECMLNNPFSSSKVYDEIFLRSKKKSANIHSICPESVKTYCPLNNMDSKPKENIQLLILNMAENLKSNGPKKYQISDAIHCNNIVAITVNYIRPQNEAHIRINWTTISSAYLNPGQKVFAKLYFRNNEKQTQTTKTKHFKDELTWNEDVLFSDVHENVFNNSSFTIKIFRKRKLNLGKILIAFAHF